MKLQRLSIILLVHFTSAGVQAADLTAVLLQVEGIVTITERPSPTASGPSRSIVRLARPLQVVRRGDSLRTPQRSRVELVCSTERRVVLLPDKTSRRQLDDQLCSSGDPLPLGSYRSLAPEAGRLRSLRGAMVLERGIRRPEDEDPIIPTLLEPRNTIVMDGRPTLRWTRVKEATEYLIEMTGEVSFQILLDALEVPCNRSPEWGDVDVCSISYPQSAPDLPPGALLDLRIAARRGIASPWYRESTSGRVQRLPAAPAAELRARLDALVPIPSEVARRLLAADLYAERGLLNDVLTVYRDPALQTSPHVLVTQGDTYLETGLLAPAAWSYQKARRIAGRPPDVDAAAELGLGWIEYARRNFAQAGEHFRRSRDLYAGRGLAREAAAAERAAEEARVRTP